MIRIPRLLVAMLCFGVLVSACRRREAAPAPAPTPAVNTDSIERERARADSIARAEQARRDSIAAADRMRAERDAAMAAARQTLLSPIYFEYDSDALDDAATAALDAKLVLLNANAPVRIRISGHADERGSDEYNLALGQRRAAAAKRFLTQRGIADERIEIISYGEERPAVQGSDESAWSQNRRDEFEVVAGTLAAPAP
ncbi:MAG TPA: peptidoglycan-associated lipoprotein Pal [Gemmatimonadaceae bacterium]|nr:peptidoglycan-associated lipoprotein Pal [Gemmatimonadaceae bacterium]